MLQGERHYLIAKLNGFLEEIRRDKEYFKIGTIGRSSFNDVADRLEVLISLLNQDKTEKDEFEIFAWFMWNKDVENGYYNGFTVENPVCPLSGTPDAKGHMWDAFPLYRKKEIKA